MRVIKLFTGLVGLGAVLVAVPVFTVGVGLLAWAGGSDRTDLPSVTVTSSDRAVVAEDIELFAGDRERFLPRTPEATISVTDDEALFVGVGPAARVEAFLADPEALPADQDFWVSTSQGDAAGIDWRLEPGSAAVVMNADGSSGVDALVQATVPSAPVRLAGTIVAVVGLGVGLLGATLIGAAWGGRRLSATSNLATA